jgi:hypothetical protein
MEDVEVDVEDVSNFFTNFMEPRTIRVPSETFVGRSRIGSQAPVGDAPPDYAPILPAGTARMTHHRASK